MTSPEGRVLFAVELPHQVENVLAVLGVEIAGRLVGQKYLWPVCEGPCDRDTLLLAAREFGWIVVTAIRKIDGIKQTIGTASSVV